MTGIEAESGTQPGSSHGQGAIGPNGLALDSSTVQLRDASSFSLAGMARPRNDLRDGGGVGSPLAADLADLPMAETVAADHPSDVRLINRELSWLDFNERVLAQAEDLDTPLLERVKFAAIFSSNLDEFFMVRVAGLMDLVAAGVHKVSPDGMRPEDNLAAVLTRVHELVARQSAIFKEHLVPSLASAGVEIVEYGQVTEAERASIERTFAERIFPVLTPLAVDPGHPFPYISNLSLSLAVVVADPQSGLRRFARVKIPPLLDRFFDLGNGARFVKMEQIIAAHLDRLFPGMEVESHHLFRVTRNADLTLEEEEADDLLAAIEVELRRRRFGRAVRMEIESSASEEVRDLLARELELEDEAVFDVSGTLDLADLWGLVGINRDDLLDPPFQPVVPPRLQHRDDTSLDFFAVLRQGDLLIHTPYENFSASVEEFIKQAALDPDVLAIKCTLYRTDSRSRIVKYLARASERGKQVAALVELKARFDEEANVNWAKTLEDAGVHVVYGLVGLKTHSKTALVVRQEGDKVRRYCHVGTGNFNAKTATLYEDLGMLTADVAVGEDLSELFNLLTGYSRQVDYKRILLAPTTLRPGMEALIDEQAEVASAGGRGRIIMKMNSLVDPSVIDHLYAASQAGVEIDLIVRGICCLRPGVGGLSENIRVRSLVGRYLEHSRIYAFGDGKEAPVRVYIGSADMMPRNLDRRIEVVIPVVDPELVARCGEVLNINLQDNVLAWLLDEKGNYHRVRPQPGAEVLNTHLILQERARRRANKRFDSEPNNLLEN